MRQTRWSGSLAVKIIATVAGVLLLLGSIGSLVRVVPSVLAPILGPERIELGQAGIAISLPRDWQNELASVYDEDWWDPDYGIPAEQHEDFLARGGVLLARTTVGTRAGHQQCTVYDWSDDDAQYFSNTVDEDPQAVSVETVRLGLPGGGAVAFDVRFADGRDMRDYLVTDGERWVMLSCGALNPPEDRWLSIAETVEFLPVEA